jgi:hypothetical protein
MAEVAEHRIELIGSLRNRVQFLRRPAPPILLAGLLTPRTQMAHALEIVSDALPVSYPHDGEVSRTRGAATHRLYE